MATLISTLGAARFDARGELRLAERLKDFLEDNAVAQHPGRAVWQASRFRDVASAVGPRCDGIVGATRAPLP